MSKKSKFIIFILASLVIASVLSLLLYGNGIPVLNPQGEIADKQRSLIIFASLLSLIVVIPVFTMTFYIVYKYRENNKSSKKYRPEWDTNKLTESLWWGVPIILITILSVVTWRSTHELAPARAINSDAKTITIQAVALQWKWLFIYPEQKVATVNYVQFPEDTPIKFQLTSDAPMNSFWIPSLGSQMYAMSGMSTELNLMADNIGDYNGSSANISGKGFAGMKFIARASSQKEFDQWIQAVKLSTKTLGMDEYDKLAQPSENNPPAYYSTFENNLYYKIMDKSGGMRGPTGGGH
jgi:cytochrome o ubiquinol oxidase subunit 2